MRIKRVQIFTETPQASEVGDLEASCREVLDTRHGTPEDMRVGESAIDGGMDGEEQKEEEQ